MNSELTQKLAQEFGKFTVTNSDGEEILLTSEETAQLISKVVEGLKNGTVKKVNT